MQFSFESMGALLNNNALRATVVDDDDIGPFVLEFTLLKFCEFWHLFVGVWRWWEQQLLQCPREEPLVS